MSAVHVPAEPEATEADRAMLETTQTSRLRELGAQYGVVVALVVMIVVFSLLRPDSFATIDNVKALLSQWAPVAVLAYGVTVVLVMEDFDLSVVGIIAVTSGIVISLMAESGVPVILALLIIVVVAVCLGVINGLLIAGLGISSFVITLATGQMFNGLTLKITDGTTIFTGIPSSYVAISTNTTLGLQNSVWIAVGLFVLFYLFLEHSQIGRYMYAIGGNQEAARLSGIPVQRIRVLGYVTTALCSAVAAVILTGQANAYSPDLSVSYLLPPYAAVFLGAAVIRPGSFNVVGTLIGALFLEVIQTGLTTLSLDTAVVLMVQGAVLVFAIVLSVLSSRRGT